MWLKRKRHKLLAAEKASTYTVKLATTKETDNSTQQRENHRKSKYQIDIRLIKFVCKTAVHLYLFSESVHFIWIRKSGRNVLK